MTIMPLKKSGKGPSQSLASKLQHSMKFEWLIIRNIYLSDSCTWIMDTPKKTTPHKHN